MGTSSFWITGRPPRGRGGLGYRPSPPRRQRKDIRKANRPSAFANGRFDSPGQWGRGFMPEGWMLAAASALRLVRGRRRRSLLVLRHELVELFLVLRVAQAVQEFAELGLL